MGEEPRSGSTVFLLWATFRDEMNRCWGIDVGKLSKQDAGVIKHLANYCKTLTRDVIRLCVCDWNSIVDYGWYKGDSPSILAIIVIKDKLLGHLTTGVSSSNYGSRYYTDYVFGKRPSNVQAFDDAGKKVRSNKKSSPGCTDWTKVLAVSGSTDRVSNVPEVDCSVHNEPARECTEGRMPDDLRIVGERPNVSSCSSSERDDGSRRLSTVPAGIGAMERRQDGYLTSGRISGTCLWGRRFNRRRRRFL